MERFENLGLDPLLGSARVASSKSGSRPLRVFLAAGCAVPTVRTSSTHRVTFIAFVGSRLTVSPHLEQSV